MIGLFNKYQDEGAWQCFLRGFWQRQFDENTTKPQKIFDIVFGVVTPIVCFALDTFILRSTSVSGVRLIPYGGAMHLFGAVAMCSLIIWLFYRRKVEPLKDCFTGVFIAAAVFPLIVGALLFLLDILIVAFVFFGAIATLVALDFQSFAKCFWLGVAALCFAAFALTPLLTGFVYYRNGVRAFNTAQLQADYTRIMAMALASANLAVAIPIVVQINLEQITERAVNAIIKSETAQDDSAVTRLKYLYYLPNISFLSAREIWSEYQSEKNEMRRANLARAYRDITGHGVNERSRYFND